MALIRSVSLSDGLTVSNERAIVSLNSMNAFVNIPFRQSPSPATHIHISYSYAIFERTLNRLLIKEILMVVKLRRRFVFSG